MRRNLHLLSALAGMLALILVVGCISKVAPVRREHPTHIHTFGSPDTWAVEAEPVADYKVSLVPSPRTDNAPPVLPKKIKATPRPKAAESEVESLPDPEAYFTPEDDPETITVLPSAGGENLPILTATPAAREETVKVGGAINVTAPMPEATPPVATMPTPATPEAVRVPGSMVRPTPFTPPVPSTAMNVEETTYR